MTTRQITRQLKAVIFDRDGTLNAESARKTNTHYTLSRADFVLLPHTRQALMLLKAAGIKTFVFTQQGCIGKGLLSESALEDIHQYCNELLGEEAEIDGFYHCPHLPEDGCLCRKPQPGMLLEIMEQNALKAETCLVIGDAPRDMEAAHNAGMAYAFVLNDTEKYTREALSAYGCPVYADVLEAVRKEVL